MFQSKAKMQKSKKVVKNVTLEDTLRARKFAACLHGATSIEYAVIASGISIVIILSVAAIRGNLVALFQSVLDVIS